MSFVASAHGCLLVSRKKVFLLPSPLEEEEMETEEEMEMEVANEPREQILLSQNNQENEALKGKINKLLGENSSLGEEVRTAQ